MGYHVLRIESPAVRLGKHGVWAEAQELAGEIVAAWTRRGELARY